MTDMMAVLLGAGSGKAAQVLAGLAGKLGGKAMPEGEGTLPQAEGADPFMAILFDRLAGAQPQGAAGTLPVAPLDVAAPGEPGAMALKPLQVAMLNAQADPAEMAFQQALAVPGMPPVSPAPTAQPGLPVAEEEGGGTAPLSDEAGGQNALAARSRGLEIVAQGTAKPDKSSAKSAGDGQLLPPGTSSVKPPVNLPERAARADLVPGVGQQHAPGQVVASIAQTLAVQGVAAGQDPAGISPGQTLQPTPGMPGVLPANAMVAMGEGLPRAHPQAGVMQLSIDAPLRSPLFHQELGERVVWLSSRQGQVAEIALHPAHLGPLEVKLSLSGGEAAAQFYSPHASVREVIESALPRLREMLADAGVTLGQTQVRDEALPRQSESAQDGSGRRGPGGEEGEGGPVGPVPMGVARSVGRGLVDLYI